MEHIGFEGELFMGTSNIKLRKFQDDINTLVLTNSDLSWEARLVCLELITERVKQLANDAIIEELRQEGENAESVCEDKLGELPK